MPLTILQFLTEVYHLAVATRHPKQHYTVSISLVRDFPEHDVYISSLTKIPPKTNVADDFFIILLSHYEISVFLLSVIVQNSSLLTGVLICLSRKSLLLRLRNLDSHVYLACVKIKRNGNTCLLAEHIYR